METNTPQAKAIADVERRAFDARITMRNLCDRAGVYQATWSRAKARRAVSIDVLLRMERALEKVESQA